MANATRNMTMTKSAYVKRTQPSTVFPTNSSAQYLIDGYYDSQTLLYFGGGSWPDSLKYNKIIGAEITVYVKPGYYYAQLKGCDGSFDPAAVTWNNRPQELLAVGGLDGTYDSSGSWGNKTVSDFLAIEAVELIKGGGFYIISGGGNANQWYAKTVLANGNSVAIKITYDDSVKNTSRVWMYDYPVGQAQDPRTDIEFAWRLSSATSYYSVSSEWTQVSGTLKWRYQGDSTWNSIAASGSEMQARIPANTLQTGKTVEYCVTVTDNDGTTTTTDVATFNTISTQITATNSPTSGYVNPRNARSFGWIFKSGTITYPSGSASLFWKSESDADYTEVAATAGADSLTIPANTFPAATTISWYLSGTDASGISSQTPVYTFSTTAGTAYATAKSPISSVEDGSAPITFRWTLSSTDGQTPSGVDLWWKLPSEAQNQWHSLLSNASPRTSYTAAAGTFPAGEIQWIVRAYNVDGTAGPWSTPGSNYYTFICVAAPNPPEGLNATSVPRTTISWQSDDQQAYEISIDGKVVQKAFGTDSTWTHAGPLSDGVHEISVRVQGQYGLWSQPAVTAINVQNQIPAGFEAVQLSGSFGIDAELELNFGAASSSVVHWFRDGERIAQESTKNGTAIPGPFRFVDRRAIGTHEYYAEIWFNDGNYVRSNSVIGTMSTQFLKIAPLNGIGEWLDLRLTEKSAGEDSFQWSRMQVLQHVTGAKYPQAELSQFEDLTASYSCAFIDSDQRKAFEDLQGKAVVLKSRGDNVIIGILNQISKRQTVFYSAYSFTISQMHVDDVMQAWAEDYA